MEIRSLGYLGIESRTAHVWEDIGPAVFGLSLAPRGVDGATLLRLDERRYRLAMYPGERDRLSYIGWELRDGAAFDLAVEELQKRGVDVEVGDEERCELRAVRGVARFKDPAGFVHEIFYSQEFDSAPFRPGRAISGFVAGVLGIPHLVVVTPAYTAELRRFLLDVMGMTVQFEPTYRAPNGAKAVNGFLRVANPRTHAIAYVARPPYRGLDHVCLEMKTMDDVGTTLDLVQERGFPITRTLGSGSLETLVSFYCRTPSGFDLEIGTGARMIDDDVWVQEHPAVWNAWGYKTPEPVEIQSTFEVRT